VEDGDAGPGLRGGSGGSGGSGGLAAGGFCGRGSAPPLGRGALRFGRHIPRRQRVVARRDLDRLEFEPEVGRRTVDRISMRQPDPFAISDRKSVGRGEAGQGCGS
jgi:hypothetical protein